MVKYKTCDAFFKRKVFEQDENCITSTPTLEKQP